MTIELVLCILFMLLAIPVSRAISMHYALFAIANYSVIGLSAMDSSALALLFGALFVADCLLILLSNRLVLVPTAIASAALAVESVVNGDWLLNHSSYLSIAANTFIAVYLAKEYWAWTRGNSGHS